MLQFSEKVAAMFFSKVRVPPQVLRRMAIVVLLILATALSIWAQTTPKARKQKAKLADKPQPEQVAPPAPAPPPPTPEQMPPRPPTVSYQNGQLSIVAPNSTLGDILQAVKSKTGASIDIPPGANERVVSRFGPGPARDVLAALLNGSHFNYVMIGSDANPTSVAQVILTPRTGGETAPANQPGQMPNAGMPQYSGQVMRPQPYPGGQVVYQPPPGATPAEEAAPAADSEEDDSAAQQDNANGADEGAPEQVNPGADGQENNGQPQVKTPEQLLQELQRQQQIQQQQQQQQGQPVPPPPPQ
jgi:hypothetical protein